MLKNKKLLIVSLILLLSGCVESELKSSANKDKAPTDSQQDLESPSIPNGLSGSNITSSTLSFSWNTASDNVTVAGYKVFRNSVLVSDQVGNSFFSFGLNPSTSYSFQVKAYDAAGNESSLSQTVVLTTIAAASSGTTYFMAPGGSDSGDGSYSNAFKTFAHSFSQMSAGDTLILKNGTYTLSQNGVITYLDSGKSGQIPSGTDRNRQTVVMAETTGQVLIDNEGEISGQYNGDIAFFVGRSTRKDSYIKIQGIRFKGTGQLFNSSYIVIKDCGFSGRFSIGTSDHDNGNSYNLIEDSWIFNFGARISSINYRGNKNVWRRVVVRSDGCDAVGCLGTGNPNVGFSVYESEDVSVENMIIIDRVLGNGYPYGDFASAQHTAGYMTGNNKWLGNISFNSVDEGFHLENDTFNDDTYFLENNVAVMKGNRNAFNIGNGSNVVVKNNTGIALNKTSGSIFRFYDNVVSMSLKNNLFYGTGAWGAVERSWSDCAYNNIFGSFSDKRYYHNGNGCTLGDLSIDPIASGSMLYPLRIEAGSTLSGTAESGKDYGANVIYRYGIDGSIFGDANYNTLSSIKLWPFPNQDLIKADLCDASYLTSAGRTGANAPGLCSSGKNLTRYIWEYFGNATPASML